MNRRYRNAAGDYYVPELPPPSANRRASRIMLISAIFMILGGLLPQRANFSLVGLIWHTLRTGPAADPRGLIWLAVANLSLALLALIVSAAAIKWPRRLWGAVMLPIFLAWVWAGDRVIKAYAGAQPSKLLSTIFFAGGMLGMAFAIFAYSIQPYQAATDADPLRA